MTRQDTLLIDEIAAGTTRDQQGVPLGMVNYMVHSRAPHQRTVRIGDRLGTLHFTVNLTGPRVRFHVWDDHTLWTAAHDGNLRVS